MCSNRIMSDTTGGQTHWESVYHTKRDDEVSWYQAVPSRSLALVLAAAPSTEAAIIDVGGGASRLVDALCAAGYRHVTVLDLSARALEIARTRLGDAGAGVRWVAADVLTHPFEPASIDVWHDRAVLHFLTSDEQQRAYAAQVRCAVAPGGTVVIEGFAPDGPERCSGLPVHRHSEDSLAALLGAGWTRVDSGRDEHITPSGSVQRFVWAVFRSDRT